MTAEQKSMMQGWIDQAPTIALLKHINNERAQALGRAIGARHGEDSMPIRMELETIHRLNQLFEVITTGAFLEPANETQPQ